MASGEVRYHPARSREDSAMELNTLRSELDRVCVCSCLLLHSFSQAVFPVPSWYADSALQMINAVLCLMD